MKVTVLGSGSRGNSILIETAEIRLLVDAGLSGREIERRLLEIDVPPASVAAVLITHDHGDHTRGMGVFARRWGVPLCLTDPTRGACAALLDGSERVVAYGSTAPVSIGDLEVTPFLTVHDAVDPIAVTVTQRTTALKVGIATDLGRATTSVRAALRGCHLLVLEANHDEARLRSSQYPWSVKSRIAGPHGHLSNRAAGELAEELCHPGLGAVVLAHLSEAANDPELARDTVGASLRKVRFPGPIYVARQEQALDTLDVGALRAARQPEQLALL